MLLLWLPPSLSATRWGARWLCSRGFQCSRGLDVSPSCLLFQEVPRTGGRNSRPCVECSEAHPFEQLPALAAAVGSLVLRGQPLASAGAWCLLCNEWWYFRASSKRQWCSLSACSPCQVRTLFRKTRAPIECVCFATSTFLLCPLFGNVWTMHLNVLANSLLRTAMLGAVVAILRARFEAPGVWPARIVRNLPRSALYIASYVQKCMFKMHPA